MTDNSLKKLVIRPEQVKDRKVVFRVIEEAFLNEIHSDHKEQFLVERLRESDAFVPELSLVAELNGQITGHILLTRARIISDDAVVDTLSLAPVSVLPTYQHRGIGSRLIRKAHDVALQLGHHSVVLIGHADYYPRFGYRQADAFGIHFPFDIPAIHCMAVELKPGSLHGVSGMVNYPAEFFTR